jgi:geranyl-CoA carboxylase alpha subunit
MTAFTTVLIANRGEIACRIIRSVHALGYRSVAVYSDADAEARHVQLADRAVHIGPAPVRDSYLDKNRLLAAARRAGADAIHPGYGFLSENAEFAAACAQAGLVFIGPPPAAIHAMGNKAARQARMIAAGVPCIPGFQDSSEQGQSRRPPARRGRRGRLPHPHQGRRRRRRPRHAPLKRRSLRATRRDQLRPLRVRLRAFGSGELILERAIVDGRHVEIQVFGDTTATSSTSASATARSSAATRRSSRRPPRPPSTRAARPHGRRRRRRRARSPTSAPAPSSSCSTPRGEFYFLEMNTRLQVEHPVTECVTGLDLVELQLRVAAGEPFPLTQDQLQPGGHAIEARLYAEDPYAGFLPQSGPVHAWHPARKARRARRPRPRPRPARHPLLRPHGRQGDRPRPHPRARPSPPRPRPRATNFIEHQLDPSARQRPLPLPRHWALAALLWARRGRPGERTGDPWRSSGPIATPLDLALLGDGAPKAHLRLTFTAPDVLLVEGAPGAAAPLSLHVLEDSGVHLRVDIDGLQRRIAAHLTDADTEADAQPALYLSDEGHTFTFREVSPKGARPGAEPLPGDGTIRAPTSGRLVALPHLVGARVAPADVVAIVEAMKIETSLNAGVHGTITSHHAELGALLRPGALLVTIQPDEAQS